jgi:hypothetical protein
MTAHLPPLPASAALIFSSPVALDAGWLVLLLPLSVAVAVVYKTIKTDDLGKLPREATYLAVQILAFMLLAGAALYLITEVV